VNTDKRTRALCVELARVTGNLPMQYREILPLARSVGLSKEEAGIAIAQAVGKKWLLTEGEPLHSIALSDAGNLMAARALKRLRARLDKR
jgi:hypothetical protein